MTHELNELVFGLSSDVLIGCHFSIDIRGLSVRVVSDVTPICINISLNDEFGGLSAQHTLRHSIASQFPVPYGLSVYFNDTFHCKLSQYPK